MRTAEKAAAYLYTVADHPALAMLANWRHRLNGAFQAVERVPRPRRDQLEALVIVIATNFASSHCILLVYGSRSPSDLALGLTILASKFL
jgi:hypothetical protein